MKHREDDHLDDVDDVTAAAAARPRIRALNWEATAQPGGASSAGADDQRLPLAACDCDNHTCSTDIPICGADVEDVDVNACGIWG